MDLRRRCSEAVTRGKQVWGVEELIRYRLALESPPEFSGPVVTEGSARFALGPLTEVAASTKTWNAMDPHLQVGPERQTFAAERVIRGETGTEKPADLPATLMKWEPSYLVATYKSNKVDAPSPGPPATTEARIPQSTERIEDQHTEGALADLVAPWSEQSNGHCETATVSGTAEHAIRALGLTTALTVELTLQEALLWMGWAGASGGAHGRRRGAAAGRFGAWWALAAICDLDFPADPDELGAHAEKLRWLWFDDGAPGTGWQLRLAIEDTAEGLGWVVAAVDSAD